MSKYVEFRTFENRAAASAAAANLLAGLLKHALNQGSRAAASLVVSGGSTPGPCFDQLANEALDWSRVTIVPSDERWVPTDHADSNDRLIRARLLTGQAKKGNVLSFFRAGFEAHQAPQLIEQDLVSLAQPFSAVLLGMGEDGHFASLFPDFAGLEAALNPAGEAQCIAVQTAGSPHLRISLTLSSLLNSKHIVLLIFGEAKRQVFETARTGDSDYPVAALLQHARQPVTVMWAP